MLTTGSCKCVADSFVMQQYDSSFRAGKDARKKDEGRFSENGVFGSACARHGHVLTLFDIEAGEG